MKEIATSRKVQHGIFPVTMRIILPERTKRILCACSKNQTRPVASIPAVDQRSAASGTENVVQETSEREIRDKHAGSFGCASGSQFEKMAGI